MILAGCILHILAIAGSRKNSVTTTQTLTTIDDAYPLHHYRTTRRTLSLSLSRETHFFESASARRRSSHLTIATRQQLATRTTTLRRRALPRFSNSRLRARDPKSESRSGLTRATYERDIAATSSRGSSAPPRLDVYSISFAVRAWDTVCPR